MFIFNPPDFKLINERLDLAGKIFEKVPVNHCFISGSFLFKEKYNDIDVFVISRKKNLGFKEKRVNLSIIDFNDVYSLFYHSVSKSCIAKNPLPMKPLKVTLSDFWRVINESVPSFLNKKNNFCKTIRLLVLYTEFFKENIVLDSFELNNKINQFRSVSDIFEYINSEIPKIFQKKLKKKYILRFFYTQAGFYKKFCDFRAQKFLYDLTHLIING
jgi:hypothetical protein